jgi:beta-lactamase regulating signal transducer with metallopeptidase domain
MTPALADPFSNFPTWNLLASKFLAYVAEPAVRSLMVGCFAALALGALRVKRVAMRLHVWAAVLGVALAMPVLGTFVPRLPLGVPASSVERISQHVSLPILQPILQRSLGPSASRVAEYQTVQARTAGLAPEGTAPAETIALVTDAATMPHVGRIAPMRARDGRLLETPKTSPLTAASSSFSPLAMPIMPFKLIPVEADRNGISRGQIAGAIALGIYFLVALMLLARLFVGMWFSRRLARAANHINDREALRLLRFRACIAGIEAPRLKECAALRVPATVGVWRAAILLPLNWRAWTAEQLDAILAHELSHVARRDALTQLLSLVHRAIFWFSPLAWWLDRELTELAEQASDEAALAGGADRTRYAETLLGFFAQLESARGRVWWQGVSMAKKSRAGSAERRVDRILAWKGTMTMKKSLAIAVVALAAPVIFLAAAVHPVITHAQDKAQDKTQSDKGNVILPGGPKAPALPNAPKGGVKGGVNGGVVAPAMPPAPIAPAPGTGVENPGPMPPAPQGGVVAPALPAGPAGGVVAPPLPAGPTGPITVRPDAPAPAPIAPIVPANASVASISAMASLAPSTPQATTHINVSDSADGRPSEAQLRAAEKAVRDAEQQVQASKAQLRAAHDALREAEKRSSEADSEQLRAAEKSLQDAEEARAQSQQTLAAQKSQYELLEQARQAQEEAERAQEDAHNAIHAHGGVYFYGYGSRYVIMSGADEGVEMSGDDEDLHHAQELRKKLGKDLIWFERDEKSYVITDPAFIAKAKALFAPEEALAKQQDELGREQDALGKQQDAFGEQMDKVSVKPPDITADLQRIQARLKELEASGATQRELGDVQRELGELQRRVGEVQRDAGVQQAAIGRQQSELGRKQGELGRRQGELGRQQGQIAREASRQLRAMFDDAIAKGIAKPE